MTHGCEASNLLCSLTRTRMVFAATRRRRAPTVAGRMIVAAVVLSVGETKDFSPGETADATSFVASISRKAASTRSASAIASVFFAGRPHIMSPIRGGLVCRLKLAEVCEQSFARRRGVLCAEHGPHTASRLEFFCQGRASPASLSAAWSPAALAVRRGRRPSERDRASRSSSRPISQQLCRGSLSKGTRSARAAVARAASSVARGAPSRRASSRYAAS